MNQGEIRHLDLVCTPKMTFLMLSGLFSIAIVNAAVTFENAHQVATVTNHLLQEASGLCASRAHADVLYTHNDSGDTNRIYAISAKTGEVRGTIYIDGAQAKDWEDIACGPCHGGSGHCVYIGDVGGNAGGDANTIYMIREPQTIKDQHVHVDDILQFSWDQHNCETLMVNPKGEVYVVSKVPAGQYGKFVHLPSSAWGSHHRVQVNEGVQLTVTDNNHGPVGGDISPNGNEVLLKMYGEVLYWYIPDGNYYKHIVEHPQTLPYHHERQGEAVCWDVKANGYYTISEGANSPLLYYRRTSSIPAVGK